MKKGDEFEIAISGIAFGGKGLAKVKGLTVFVDQAVPQDVMRVRVVRKKKQFAEAIPLQLLSPSPLRVSPPCEYSGICGGCQWQFLGYEHQLDFKQQHVAEALQHIGGLKNIPVHPTLPSAKQFGYRNKMEFSCSDRRWLQPHEMGQSIDNTLAVGLHVPGTYYKILDTKACLLQPDAGNQILADIREHIRTSVRRPYNLRSHEGFWRFLVLRHSLAKDQWMVNLITAAAAPTEMHGLAEQLLANHPQIITIVNNISAKKAAIAVGDYQALFAGSGTIEERIGDYLFEISANSFFQTNTSAATTLYEIISRYARLEGTEQVLDLYCGTGSIAIYLSSQARHITGLEIVPAAIADARRNCERNGVRNCCFQEGDVNQQLSQLDVQPDVVIIDPPRAGLHRQVVTRLLDMAPPRLVYVSCNPANLARDAALLAERYTLCEVQPVDLFPHTYHIESVARLERI